MRGCGSRLAFAGINAFARNRTDARLLGLHVSLTVLLHRDLPAQSAQSFSLASGQKDSQIDLKKLTKQAVSGDIPSQVQLGFDYQFGEGVEQNYGWGDPLVSQGRK